MLLTGDFLTMEGNASRGALARALAALEPIRERCFAIFGERCFAIFGNHDPSAFHHVPAGEVDLAFSGHTHGGQVGPMSLGFDWTVLRGSRGPAHGLFARGASRLYVHRGTGFYGFPLRVGVPGEFSILELVVD